MARFAQLLMSDDYAVGAACYTDSYPEEEHSARIVLPVVVEGHFTTPAIVDTGAPWCILDPEIVEAVSGRNSASYDPGQTIRIRGIPYDGKLQRMRLTVRTEYGGTDLEVDATVFVPILLSGEAWRHPNFIGLDGFLNRVRFAIDPAENVFYFGPT